MLKVDGERRANNFAPAAKWIQFDSEEEWMSYRNSRKIGASESAILFGQGYAGSSVFRLHHEKLGVIEREPMTGKFLTIGKMMEPVLRKLFTSETHLLCLEAGANSLCESVEFPFLVASLDGIVVDESGEVGVLELKNIHQMNRDEWVDGCGPLKYQIQVQHQLAVTGLKYGYLFGLIGGQEPFAHRVARNDDFIFKALIPQCEKFIAGLESGVPPEIDGSEATARAICLLHPDDDGTEVVLDDRFVDLDLRLEELKKKEKEIDTEKKLLENEIKATIGAATYGLLPNGVKYSFKTQNRDGYYVEPCKYRALRRSRAK